MPKSLAGLGRRSSRSLFQPILTRTGDQPQTTASTQWITVGSCVTAMGRTSAIKSALGKRSSSTGKGPTTCTMTAWERGVGWHASPRARILRTGPSKARPSVSDHREAWIQAPPRPPGCITTASGGTCSMSPLRKQRPRRISFRPCLTTR